MNERTDGDANSSHCSRPYAQALALELEGVVGKLADSHYLPGQRTKNWFKLKRPGAVLSEPFQAQTLEGSIVKPGCD